MKTASRNAKLFVVALCLFILTLPITSCEERENPITSSLGDYTDFVFYSSGIFHDCEYYAKYYYASANLEENEYFKKIEASDLLLLNELLDDFEDKLEVVAEAEDSETAENFDFNREIMDAEDYVYILAEKSSHGYYFDYTIYLFDSQTLVLYYFYNNT